MVRDSGNKMDADNSSDSEIRLDNKGNLKNNTKIHVIQASFLKRIFAFIIDLIILNIFVFSPFNSLINQLHGGQSFNNLYHNLLSNQELLSSISSILIPLTFLILIYFIVLQTKLSQTIGMMLMNLYVVKIPEQSLRSSGSAKRKPSLKEIAKASEKIKVGFLSALLRNLFLIPFAPFVFLWIIDPIYLFLNRNSQRLTEFLSRTMVVEIMLYNTNNFNKQRWM